MKTPIIDDILATHEQGFVFRDGFHMGRLATELRALLTERDDLQLRLADAMKYTYITPTPPRDAAGIQGASHPRRLREYKGATYREGCWWRGDTRYGSAAHVITADDSDHTDADHAALLALRDDPWEDAGTLEQTIERGYKRWRDEDPMGSTIHYVAKEVRAWLATQPQTITPEQAVAVLVEKGAKRCQFIDVGGNGLVLTRGGFKGEKLVSVLILPEPTP